MSKPTYFSTSEPLTTTSELPQNYSLVRKGNIYITKNCRQKTHEAQRTVYVVLDNENQKLGIGVPRTIYQQVQTLCEQTAEARAKAVEKKDLALEKKTQTEIMRQFPHITKASVPAILKHTLQKRSGRVGRTSEPLDRVVSLAVRAHIRHKHTEYDKMLRQGTDREEARRTIQDAVEEKVRDWGGKPWSAKASNTVCKNKKTRRTMTQKVLEAEVGRRSKVIRKLASRTPKRARRRTPQNE